MKKYAIVLIMIFVGINYHNAQTIVLNDKLLLQLTKNQAVRLASNESFFNSYEKQTKLYDDINKRITQVIAIQEYIYKQLTNVNMAITQGKKLKYIYKDLGQIIKYSDEMLNLTLENPQYSILISNYYIHIGKEVLKIKQKIQEDILNENKDWLMDPYDREILLEKIYLSVREIMGTVLCINIYLKNAKQTPYIHQIPVLQDYVCLDKVIIEDIMNKSSYIF